VEYRRTSGWYYVGNGQLRFMDDDGWTEQYRNIDNPPRAVPPAEPGPISAAPADREPADRPSRPIMAWFLAGAVTAALAVMAGAPRALGALFEQSAQVLAPAPTAQGGPAEGAVAGPPPPSPAAPVTASPAAALPASPAAALTASPTATLPASPVASPPSASPTPVLSPSPPAGTFRVERVLAKAGDIIGDIKIVDQCLADGVDVNSALTLLNRSYVRLAESGVPPGLDRSEYVLRVRRLQTLTLQAAEGYDHDPTQAIASYSAVRSETRALFEQLNVALGSNLSLP
jgi:hypothetical protein